MFHPIGNNQSTKPAQQQQHMPNVLLHLKSTPGDATSTDMLNTTNSNVLKRSVSAMKEDSGGLTQEMQEFIREFKTRRVNLGYTQDDVGRELSALNGPTYSQSFISRYLVAFLQISEAFLRKSVRPRDARTSLLSFCILKRGR